MNKRPVPVIIVSPFTKNETKAIMWWVFFFTGLLIMGVMIPIGIFIGPLISLISFPLAIYFSILARIEKGKLPKDFFHTKQFKYTVGIIILLIIFLIILIFLPN